MVKIDRNQICVKVNDYVHQYLVMESSKKNSSIAKIMLDLIYKEMKRTGHKEEDYMIKPVTKKSRANLTFFTNKPLQLIK